MKRLKKMVTERICDIFCTKCKNKIQSHNFTCPSFFLCEVKGHAGPPPNQRNIIMVNRIGHKFECELTNLPKSS